MNSGITRIVTAVVALSVSLGVGADVNAQCALAWDPQFAPAGASHLTTCAAVFDDGSGPALYVGGQFTMIGGIFASFIARYDGESWSNVGAPFNAFNNNIAAMAVYDDGNGAALYVAGNVTNIGGVPVPRIAKWNGTSWSAPIGGGFDAAPSQLYVTSAPTGQPRLYATGPFSTAGGNSAQGVAVYDGSTWTSIPGLPSSLSVQVVEFDDPATPQSDLFISPSIAGIYRYDGISLVNIAPSGIGGGSVLTMETYDDGNGPCLYVGGSFSNVDGVSASRIAKWNGSTWSAVGGGVTSDVEHRVRDLCVWDDGNGPALYVGGIFLTAGTTSARNIARWNGTSWSALGAGAGSTSGSPEVRDIVPFDAGAGEGLAILGDFMIPRQHMAFWTGTEMRGLGDTNGVGAPLNTATIGDLAIYDDAVDGPLLVAGGTFVNAGPIVANRIAAWDGYKWQTLGPGFNQSVTSLVVFDDGNGTQLYASGSFGFLNDTQTVMDRFARWDGSQWHNVGASFAALDMLVFDDGNGAAVYALRDNDFGEVYRWDGQSWTPVGTALGRLAFRLAVFDDGNGAALYLGARSSQVGAAANDSLLKWNGVDWIAMGGGVQRPDFFSSIIGLMPFEYGGKPVLAVSGTFEGAGAVAGRGVIFWDGSQWITPPGPQPANASAGVMTVHDDGTGPALYASGIDIASTTYNDLIAKLTPSGWQSMAFGLSGGAHNAMQSYDTEGGSSLYVAGGFQWFYTAPTFGIAQKRVGSITRWFTCLDEPSIISSPGDQSVPTASTVEFEAEAGGGDLTYRWRRDGVPLNNNAQQTGVDLPHLTLFNVDAGDEGEYDLVVTNAAGTDTSDAATLTVTLPCFADIDSDNQVSINDLLEVINNWGACPGTCPPACSADVDPSPNGDCQVNINDLLLVINSWGSCP